MKIAALVLATTLFHLHDVRIGEASGVAVATREASVWFTHNDSGDSARYFALGPIGQTIATYDVSLARNVDWEDMAEAPNAAHVPTLWLGDIGDNDAVRKTVDVYATPEPHVTSAVQGRTLHVKAVRYRFRYPDGPHDAESLLVDPLSAQIYVATKSYLGDTDVYAAPAKPSATSTSRRTATRSCCAPTPMPICSPSPVLVPQPLAGRSPPPRGGSPCRRSHRERESRSAATARRWC